jgi:hypothetical protein
MTTKKRGPVDDARLIARQLIQCDPQFRVDTTDTDLDYDAAYYYALSQVRTGKFPHKFRRVCIPELIDQLLSSARVSVSSGDEPLVVTLQFSDGSTIACTGLGACQARRHAEDINTN